MQTIKNVLASSIVSVLLLGAISARAADSSVERMATCQDSWLEWKGEPAELEKIVEHIDRSFIKKEGAPFLVPRTGETVLGLPVIHLYPESIGMAVGFSVLVDADFAETRKGLEKKIGRAFEQCETADNMRSCALKLSEKKNLLLMEELNGKNRVTLFGCYYYYAK